MLAHDFVDMPSKSVNVGDNPHETVMLLRCKSCLKSPAKAREDGCPVRELQEVGRIILSEYNPDGVEYFKGRKCVTCDGPIMSHWLRHGNQEYWCFENQNQFSYGINDCIYDVSLVSPVVEETGTKGTI